MIDNKSSIVSSFNRGGIMLLFAVLIGGLILSVIEIAAVKKRIGRIEGRRELTEKTLRYSTEEVAAIKKRLGGRALKKVKRPECKYQEQTIDFLADALSAHNYASAVNFFTKMRDTSQHPRVEEKLVREFLGRLIARERDGQNYRPCK